MSSDKQVILKQLPGKKEDYVLYIEHDIDSVSVKAVRKSQVDKVLKTYKVSFVNDLYGDSRVDWEKVQQMLFKGAVDLEYIDVFTY